MPAFLKDIGHLFRTFQVCGQAPVDLTISLFLFISMLLFIYFMIYFQVCGQAPVDLTKQARADIGDVFAGNVIFGFVLLFALIVLHLLFLHIPAY